MAVVREIKYFDYMENETKLGNAGHVKVDWWEGGNGEHRRAEGALQICLNHLPTEYIPGSFKGSGASIITLETARGQLQLGNIEIENGGGGFTCSLEVLQEHLGEEITYEDIWSISISLGDKHKVFCRLHEPQIVQEPDSLEQMVQEEEAVTVVGEPEEELFQLGMDTEEELFRLGMATEEEQLQSDMDTEEGKVEISPVEMEAAAIPSLEEGAEQRKKIPRASYGEDKWSHLCNIYPKITPFSDSREYLKIGPNDFVVLHQKYYSLVHNSFMLHGYYQYGQLVLCRVLRRGKPLYYVGTPGVYLEQDKQVALMYGFQSFECDSEPAGEGDFGYYMIQVEL